MSEQFENPEVAKVEELTVSDASAQKRIKRVAEKLAGKSSHTEQKSEQDSSSLFKVK